MDITVDELLRGSATSIKGKNYLSTEQYVTPFLNKMSSITSDFKVQIKLADQLTLEREGDSSVPIYNKVLIQAVLSQEYQLENHSEVIGMVYGLDVRKPVAKFYKGGINSACTNLCVFNPSDLYVQGIQDSQVIDFSPLNLLADSQTDVADMVGSLKSLHFNNNEETIDKLAGSWLRNIISSSHYSDYGVFKLGCDSVASAYKLLFTEKESPYYCPKDKESIDMYTIYNAFTQLITDDQKDIVSKVEKTLLLRKVLQF